jgi:hypothetical protein
MFSKLSLLLITGAIMAGIASLSACGKSDEPVAFATLEDARAQARANGEYNAQLYRAENPRFTDHKIVSHGDSTQSPECPQGDGWASNTIMSVKDKVVEKFKIKCSTVSVSLGCYLEDDFAKKPFASEEGHCQNTNKVPHPLPKLAK